MQPMNYTIQTPDVGQGFMQGAQNTASMIGAMNEANLARQKQEALAEQQRQDAIKRQRFSEVAMDPSASKVRQLMIQYPELADKFKESMNSLSDVERQDATGSAYALVTALKQGKGQQAIDFIDQKIEAAKNGGDAVNLQRYTILKDSVLANPNGALLSLQGILLGQIGAKDYAELEKMDRENQLQPAALKEANAKAEKAAIAAKFAESQEVMDLEKKGWDINKLKNDIRVANANVAIAAQNAAVNRANSDTARQEAQIKLQELIDKRATTIREKTSEIEGARSSIDNMLNTADRIINTPFSVIDSAAGPVSSRMPTLSSDTADFEALVENLDAQSFIAQIPNMKGTGALSDAEGKKLAAALQNFSLKQSPERLVQNVKEAQRIMLNARKRLADKYGVPDTIPDTPQAKPQSGKTTDDILRELGVQ